MLPELKLKIESEISMKLPLLSADNSLHKHTTAPFGASCGRHFLDNNRSESIIPASVEFSPRWNHFSWNNAHGTDLETERQLILEMVRNSQSPLVRQYAANNICNVYVRTGIHPSDADPADHVQVQLGLPAPPWQSADCLGYTCHIRYAAAPAGGYPTTCFAGLHAGGN
jgi:hypothetical protein